MQHNRRFSTPLAQASACALCGPNNPHLHPVPSPSVSAKGGQVQRACLTAKAGAGEKGDYIANTPSHSVTKCVRSPNVQPATPSDRSSALCAEPVRRLHEAGEFHLHAIHLT